jgi:hypothetical protein
MITLLVVLIIVGVALYFVPMDPGVKQVIVAVVAIAALVALLSLFGLVPALRTR